MSRETPSCEILALWLTSSSWSRTCHLSTCLTSSILSIPRWSKRTLSSRFMCIEENFTWIDSLPPRLILLVVMFFNALRLPRPRCLHGSLLTIIFLNKKSFCFWVKKKYKILFFFEIENNGRIIDINPYKRKDVELDQQTRVENGEKKSNEKNNSWIDLDKRWFRRMAIRQGFLIIIDS